MLINMVNYVRLSDLLKSISVARVKLKLLKMRYRAFKAISTQTNNKKSPQKQAFY